MCGISFVPPKLNEIKSIITFWKNDFGKRVRARKKERGRERRNRCTNVDEWKIPYSVERMEEKITFAYNSIITHTASNKNKSEFIETSFRVDSSKGEEKKEKKKTKKTKNNNEKRNGMRERECRMTDCNESNGRYTMAMRKINNRLQLKYECVFISHFYHYIMHNERARQRPNGSGNGVVASE